MLSSADYKTHAAIILAAYTQGSNQVLAHLDFFQLRPYNFEVMDNL